jgi:hypothetical protein
MDRTMIGAFGGLLSKLAMLAIVLGGAVAIYGYTASNVVPLSRAGQGSGVVTPYTISGTPVYTLNALSPQSIDSVQVTLSAAPATGATLKAQLRSGGTWFTCTSSGASLTCPTTGETVTANGTMSLTVVAAD